MFFQRFMGKSKEQSKTSAFLQNSTRLRNTILSIIRKVEDGNTKMGVSAEPDIMEIVDRQIEEARAEITEWQDYDTDYIQIANSMLCNITFDLLVSGRYHLWAGKLNEMSAANRLHDIYKDVMDWALRHDQISKEDYDACFVELRRQIRSL